MTNPETSSDLVKRLRQTARDFASNGIAEEAATTIERLTAALGKLTRRATHAEAFAEKQRKLHRIERAKAEAAEAEVTRLSALNARQAEALRQNFCPRPCNGRPDDLSVGACIDFGECGCMNGAALATESSNG